MSTHAFIIGNALFAVLAIGVVAFIRANTQSNRARFAKPRLAAVTLGVLVTVAALVGGLKSIERASGRDIGHGATVSINALMQQIDVRSLPVQEAGSFF